MKREPSDGTATAEAEPPRRLLDLPAATIIKVLAAAVVVWLWIQLWTLVMLVLVAVVLAIAFEPVVAWLERRRVPRGAGSPLVILSVVVVLAVFIGICGSTLASQARDVGDRLLELDKQVVQSLPGPLQRVLEGTDSAAPQASEVAGYALVVARAIMRGVLITAIASILTVYLLIEGQRTWVWLVAYVPRRQRAKVRVTAAAAQRSVLHYVAGNVATSIFAGVWVFVALSALHVPAALLLAVLAGVCDFVPVLGFLVSAVPAVLLAFTVSNMVGVTTAGLYALYHVIENYIIAPKVYGDQLRLSNLAVLIAFAVGAELGGAVGALLALPAAAMYPVIEEVWLRDYLAPDAVDTHRRLEETGTA